MVLPLHVLLVLLVAAPLSGLARSLIDNSVLEPYVDNDPAAVPSFLIIGTSKGGTTDLYEQLATPNPERSEPAVVHSQHKEPGVLSSGGVDLLEFLPGKPQYKAYLGLLQHPCANFTWKYELRDCLATTGRRHYTVDATPTSYFMPSTPLALLGLSTRSKVIMMVREPLERAEVLFRHLVVEEKLFQNTTLDLLADAYLEFIRSRPHVKDALDELTQCKTVECLSEGWRELAGYGFIDEEDTKIFSSGLYRYALAPWRQHYFTPGRFMIIDSHEYFRNRADVMDKVTRFLYGRPLLPSEKAQAGSGSFWRKDASLKLPKLVLSAERKSMLQAFYATHVHAGLQDMLQALRREGAWVVGFEGEPWK